MSSSPGGALPGCCQLRGMLKGVRQPACVSLEMTLEVGTSSASHTCVHIHFTHFFFFKVLVPFVVSLFTFKAARSGQGWCLSTPGVRLPAQGQEPGPICPFVPLAGGY